MEDHGVRDLVFSASRTVYGQPDVVPVTEAAPVGASSPYGRTKLFIEEMLRDHARAASGWRIASLRYFNPVGAHPSGRIGEDPVGTPNNLMPYAMQVAVGRHPHVRVFGDDYDTPDGHRHQGLHPRRRPGRRPCRRPRRPRPHRAVPAHQSGHGHRFVGVGGRRRRRTSDRPAASL